MSLKNSLSILFNKIIQKNIVLVFGNVDDIFPDYFLPNKKENSSTRFISLVEYIKLLIQENNNYKTIKFFSSSKGIIDLINRNEAKKDLIDEDFVDLDNNKPSIDDFIDEISNSLNCKEVNGKNSGSLYIIECSDIFLDKSGNGIRPAKLSELISNFTSFNNNSSFINLSQNDKKLVLIARNQETITNFVSINNLEFSSIAIAKPDKNERNDFFNSFKNWFDLKPTFNNPDHDDYKEALVISDGLSFKEIIQLSKLNNEITKNKIEKITFKQLYNLANYNKQNSEWEKINFSDLKKIKEILSERVKGQELAINIIEKTLIRSFTGLNGIVQSIQSKKPKGVLFLAGPTGTGKTEISKTLCNFIFGDESRLIRFDMSEYNHEHSDQRLIGAPPGYIGYDVGGQLTTSVKNKPFCILLFDEIEKAHPKILDKFLQILEDGRLTSSQGEIVDFSETFIIFTSNIGTSKISIDLDKKETQNKFINAVENYFKNELKRPELLNRIGVKNIVPFNFISDENIIKEIIDMKIKSITKNLREEKKINCLISKEAENAIVDLVIDSYDKNLGGRGIVIELETQFIDKLANFIFQKYENITLNKNNNNFSNISVNFQNCKLTFDL